MTLKATSTSYVPTEYRNFNAYTWISELYEAICKKNEPPPLPVAASCKHLVKNDIILAIKRFTNGLPHHELLEILFIHTIAKTSNDQAFIEIKAHKSEVLDDLEKKLLHEIIEVYASGGRILLPYTSNGRPCNLTRDSLMVQYLESLPEKLNTEQRHLGLRCLVEMHHLLPEDTLKILCSKFSLPMVTSSSRSALFKMAFCPERIWKKREFINNLHLVNRCDPHLAMSLLSYQKGKLLSLIAQGRMFEKFDIVIRYLQEHPSFATSNIPPESAALIIRQCLLWGASPISLIDPIITILGREGLHSNDQLYLEQILKDLLQYSIGSELEIALQAISRGLSDRLAMSPALLKIFLEASAKCEWIDFNDRFKTWVIHETEKMPLLFDLCCKIKALENKILERREQSLKQRISQIKKPDQDLLKEIGSNKELLSFLCHHVTLRNNEELSAWILDHLERELMQSKSPAGDNYRALLFTSRDDLRMQKWITANPTKQQLSHFLESQKKLHRQFDGPFTLSLKTELDKANLPPHAVLMFFSGQNLDFFPWDTYFSLAQKAVPVDLKAKLKRRLSENDELPLPLLKHASQATKEDEILKFLPLLSQIEKPNHAILLSQLIAKRTKINPEDHLNHIDTLLRIENPSFEVLRAAAHLIFAPRIPENKLHRLTSQYARFLDRLIPKILTFGDLSIHFQNLIEEMLEYTNFAKPPRDAVYSSLDSKQPLPISTRLPLQQALNLTKYTLQTLDIDFDLEAFPQITQNNPGDTILLSFDDRNGWEQILIEKIITFPLETAGDRLIQLLCARSLLYWHRKKFPKEIEIRNALNELIFFKTPFNSTKCEAFLFQSFLNFPTTFDLLKKHPTLLDWIDGLLRNGPIPLHKNAKDPTLQKIISGLTKANTVDSRQMLEQIRRLFSRS